MPCLPCLFFLYPFTSIERGLAEASWALQGCCHHYPTPAPHTHTPCTLPHLYTCLLMPYPRFPLPHFTCLVLPGFLLEMVLPSSPWDCPSCVLCQVIVLFLPCEFPHFCYVQIFGSPIPPIVPALFPSSFPVCTLPAHWFCSLLYTPMPFPLLLLPLPYACIPFPSIPRTGRMGHVLLPAFMNPAHTFCLLPCIPCCFCAFLPHHHLLPSSLGWDFPPPTTTYLGSATTMTTLPSVPYSFAAHVLPSQPCTVSPPYLCQHALLFPCLYTHDCAFYTLPAHLPLLTGLLQFFPLPFITHIPGFYPPSPSLVPHTPPPTLFMCDFLLPTMYACTYTPFIPLI